jgi:hypothetical protein
MSKCFHSAFGGAPFYPSRGEMAPLDQKITGGNDNPSNKVKPYEIEIKFDGTGEYYCRATVLRHDYHWRALSVLEIRRQIRATFPNLRFEFVLSRSAELATNPQAILRG